METVNQIITTISKLHLIDLAGSEKLNKTLAEGSSLVEATNINKSLLQLRIVISSLVNNPKGFINFRSSKLTNFLKDSLGGSSKTVLIANISPSKSSYYESLQTLQFAQEAKKVKNQKARGIRIEQQTNFFDEQLNQQYQREIKTLKEQREIIGQKYEESQKQKLELLELVEQQNIQLKKEKLYYSENILDIKLELDEFDEQLENKISQKLDDIKNIEDLFKEMLQQYKNEIDNQRKKLKFIENQQHVQPSNELEIESQSNIINYNEVKNEEEMLVQDEYHDIDKNGDYNSQISYRTPFLQSDEQLLDCSWQNQSLKNYMDDSVEFKIIEELKFNQGIYGELNQIIKASIDSRLEIFNKIKDYLEKMEINVELQKENSSMKQLIEFSKIETEQLKSANKQQLEEMEQMKKEKMNLIQQHEETQKVRDDEILQLQNKLKQSYQINKQYMVMKNQLNKEIIQKKQIIEFQNKIAQDELQFQTTIMNQNKELKGSNERQIAKIKYLQKELKKQIDKLKMIKQQCKSKQNKLNSSKIKEKKIKKQQNKVKQQQQCKLENSTLNFFDSQIQQKYYETYKENILPEDISIEIDVNQPNYTRSTEQNEFYSLRSRKKMHFK